jgi:ribonuclease R
MLPRADAVAAHIRQHPGCRTRELARSFGVADQDFDAFVKELEGLQAEGEILRLPRGEGWELPARTEYRVGKLELDRRGSSGFVRVAAGSAREDDIFVRGAALSGAFPGDLVLVRIERRARGDLLREGTVVEVVERTRRLVRGKYRAGKRGGCVTPAGRRRAIDIHIPPEESAGARDGEEVLVRLLDGKRGDQPGGQVVARLEREGTLATDLQAIAAEFDLPLEHPPAVLDAAGDVEAIRDGASWPERIDLRGVTTFTIDPEDAKDFDDAVSLEPLPGGDLRLGVHIADVSHHVPPGSLLDRAAEDRGTSVYLPGRVLHMLPPRLANELCSLRPGEDRLAMTARLTYSHGGSLKKTEVFSSVIRSARRFTYEEVLAILHLVETGKATASLPPDHAAFERVLGLMAHLRDRLNAERHRRGALYLDIPKLRLHLDEAGNVTGLGRDERDPSHSLIEEFMLAANEAVARYFIDKKLPLVARIHSPPKEKKLADLRLLLEALGLRLPPDPGHREIQKLVADVSGEPFSPLVQLALLRSMEHATYARGAGLHFALATRAYCHFTSPIRRYPDLLVHQVLAEHLGGKLHRGARRREWDGRLEERAARASELERRAEEAEREMIRLRLIRHLKPRIGEEMDGCIVSIHPFGFFVRADESLVEGLVHVATLGDDYYEFDREKLALAGKGKRRQFKIGERVRVELQDLDIDLREISFRFVRKLGGGR